MIRIIILCVLVWLAGSLIYGAVSPESAHQAQRNAVEMAKR